MAHDPEWEQLADVLKRVTATGVTENEAQVAICSAISDREIRVRLFVGNIERADIFLLEGRERSIPSQLSPRDFAWRSERFGLPPPQISLMIPSCIAPQDFDWRQSRPLKPWRDVQGALTLDWHRDRIELFAADVTRVLIAPRIEPLNRTRSEDRDLLSGSGAKTLGITNAIKQLWPLEIPQGLSAKDRNRAIIDWLKENNCSIPKNPERAIQRVLKALRAQQSG
jgi:hypothetical protein